MLVRAYLSAYNEDDLAGESWFTENVCCNLTLSISSMPVTSIYCTRYMLTFPVPKMCPYRVFTCALHISRLLTFLLCRKREFATGVARQPCEAGFICSRIQYEPFHGLVPGIKVSVSTFSAFRRIPPIPSTFNVVFFLPHISKKMTIICSRFQYLSTHYRKI